MGSKPSVALEHISNINSDSNSIINIENEDNQQNDNESRQLLESSHNLMTTSQESSKPFNYKKRVFKSLLYLVDVLASIILFSPLVSTYWYCTWLYLDDFFMKESEKLSNLISYGTGLTILLFSYLFQENLQNFYNRLKLVGIFGGFLCFLMHTCYIYTICFAVILEWRGLWNLMDFYFFKDINSQVVLAIIAMAFFCLTRSTKTLISTPFVLYMDDYENFFTSESRYHLGSGSGYFQYTMDFLLSEIVEGFAQVAAWRGLGNLYDEQIFPSKPFYSIITSFSISHGMYLLIAIVETMIYRRFTKRDLVPRIVAEDLIQILQFASAVLAWKFYWNVIDFYFYTQSNAYNLYVIGHFCTFIIAVFLQVSAVLVGPGIRFLDGEVSGGESYFEINYFSHIFQHLHHDKQNEMPELTSEQPTAQTSNGESEN